jgi:hypothetical protein
MIRRITYEESTSAARLQVDTHDFKRNAYALGTAIFHRLDEKNIPSGRSHVTADDLDTVFFTKLNIDCAAFSLSPV